MEKIRVGIIGLGGRGFDVLRDNVLPRSYVIVTGVCDKYDDRCEKAVETVKATGQPSPFSTTDYRELLELSELDAVLITCAWEPHIEIACAAMKAGKYTAVEVGGAYSVDDCWRLVRTHEETGVHCMLMENCCYGRVEMMVLNMARQGLFGEIVHCRGGYHHDLRHEIAYGSENRHYRLRNYLCRNCENYPTHELGPIAQLLDINRGNRMLTLNSVASKAAGLRSYIIDEFGPEHDAAGMNFTQGDVVTTIIKCARGETITLTLETTLARAYSRGYEVHGAKGTFIEDNMSIFLDKKDNAFDFEWRKRWGSADEYRAEYEHPVWKQSLEEGVRGGHGGMDWLVFSDFFAAVKEGKPAPIDVYDMAAWMSVSCLSEDSVAMGGAPVAIPDFTNGKWINTK